MQEHYQILNFNLCRIAQSRQIYFILEGIKIGSKSNSTGWKMLK